MEINIDQVKEKYKELKTLTKVAEYFDVSIETIRHLFIANNIEYSKRQKYNCNHEFFSNHNERSFYWAGFLAADGNIEKNSNRIKLELKSTDKNHILKFKEDINCSAPMKYATKHENREKFKKKEYYSVLLRFNSEQMVHDLEKFGVVSCKSRIFTIPEYVKSHKYFKHYIRGLIDGDGYLRKVKNSSEINLSGTNVCVNDVFNHLNNVLKLNYGFIIHRDDGLNIMRYSNFKDTVKIVDYLYANASIYLDRKYEIAKQILEIKPRKISIEKEYLKMLLTKNNYKNQKTLANKLGISVSTVIRRMKEYEYLIIN